MRHLSGRQSPLALLALSALTSRVTPLRFRPLEGGGLLLAALHEETSTGVAHGRVVLLRFLPGGEIDAGFGVDGVTALDLALGGPPYALPRTLSAPTLIGQDRVMLTGWGADHLGAVSVQMRALRPSSGTLGWLARDGHFSPATDATLHFGVAHHGGRRGAVGVNYRSARSQSRCMRRRSRARLATSNSPWNPRRAPSGSATPCSRSRSPTAAAGAQ